MDFEESKLKQVNLTSFFFLSLSLMLVNQNISSQLLVQCHASLTAAMLCTIIVMTSNPLKL